MPENFDDEARRQRYEMVKARVKEIFEERRKQKRARQRHERALADARRKTLVGEKALADARRKTLIGEMVLDHTQADAHDHGLLIDCMNSYLEDPKDRALFGLPPRTDTPASDIPADP